MLTVNAKWTIQTVVTIHVLRLFIGLMLVRVLYPMIFSVSPATVEITDRVVMIVLVVFTIRYYQGNLSQLGISLDHAAKNIAMGVIAGAVLLLVSFFSERLYTTVLWLSPSQHPLVAQVENAANWRQLLMPLFLAGVAAPVAEEMLYRVFTFLPLKERWGLWGGALASAALFALMHFNAFWLAEMMIVGVGLALLYYWTGSVISAITAHSFVNTTKILLIFYGVSII